MGALFQHLRQYIGNGFTIHLWNGFVAFAIVMVIGFFVKYFLNTIGRKLVSKTDTELDDKLLTFSFPV